MQTLDPTANSNPQDTQPSFDRQDWLSGYRSQPQEFDYWIDQVEGEIPADLNGTLFRNGPGLLDIGGHPVRHPFDGDGMISAIAFRNGRAFYRNRYVKTEGYVAEQTAGKPLFRGVFGTQKPGGWLANALDLKLKNIANTNILYWGDRLLALWEAAHPHRLDPHTLDTQGLDNLDGLLAEGDAFSAHPRIDPDVNGQPRLVNFGVKAGLSSTLSLYEFDPQGTLVSQHSHTIPGFAFLHDFALTPHYAIFFQNPVSFNPIPFLLGMKGAAECLKFNPKQPTRILLVPRDGSAPITIAADPCFVFHHANAYERDGQVVIDSICYDRFPSVEDGNDYKTVNFDKVPPGQLRRFTVDLATQQATSQDLVTRSCEFPVMHPDLVGRACRYCYLGVTHAPTGNAPLQGLVKLDLETGEEQIWSAAPRGFGGEAVFVPRPNGQAEDDGWLLLLLYNAERQCSDLAIFDASDITTGPVARLLLNHHVPYGLHGSFTPINFDPQA
jgi:all-trans-8'-apo-beta-carotenal 15,15'-oxygenase